MAGGGARPSATAILHADAPVCMADGGTLMPELMDAMPAADWDAVLEATFLEG